MHQHWLAMSRKRSSLISSAIIYFHVPPPRQGRAGRCEHWHTLGGLVTRDRSFNELYNTSSAEKKANPNDSPRGWQEKYAPPGADARIGWSSLGVPSKRFARARGFLRATVRRLEPREARRDASCTARGREYNRLSCQLRASPGVPPRHNHCQLRLQF